MPTKTFFNLDSEKRNKIIDVAINEFANCYYHQASVNHIVEQANIAKGSFYQYFANKRDLYKYLLFGVVESKKLDYLKQQIYETDNLDFFRLLHRLYSVALKFGTENPKLQAIENKFLKLGDHDFKEELLAEASNKSKDFFKQLLVKGVAEGQIKEKLDLDMLSLILTQFNLSSFEYYLKRFNLDKENKLDSCNRDKIMELISKLIYIIENGIEYN